MNVKRLLELIKPADKTAQVYVASSGDGLHLAACSVSIREDDGGQSVVIVHVKRTTSFDGRELPIEEGASPCS